MRLADNDQHVRLTSDIGAERDGYVVCPIFVRDAMCGFPGRVDGWHAQREDGLVSRTLVVASACRTLAIRRRARRLESGWSAGGGVGMLGGMTPC